VYVNENFLNLSPDYRHCYATSIAYQTVDACGTVKLHACGAVKLHACGTVELQTRGPVELHTCGTVELHTCGPVELDTDVEFLTCIP
jgi:hypothetical protein